jgi:hypothetical protein
VRRAVAALTLLLAAACTGGSTDHPSPSAPEPSPTVLPSPSPSPSPTVGALTVQIWFTREGKLFPVTRSIPNYNPDVGTEALNALLAGPDDAEEAAGVRTAIPDGTKLENLDIDVGFAHPSFSTAVESDPLSDAQVVYTLTQFPTLERVQINQQEGGPLSRKDLEGQLPPIVVLSPPFGEQISSPVTVSGTADVFEAVVSIRILDENDDVIAHTTTMATCGSGCRGRYTKDVSYSVDHDQPGYVMVFEVSEENGLPIDPVKIRVTLTA